MTGRTWTLSNGLSILRILLVVPVSILLSSGSAGDRVTAALLIALAALTDYLDGLIARKRNQVTGFGKIIDPVADKVGIGAVTVILAARGELPAWFAAAVVGRDLAILASAAFLSGRGAGVPQSNRAGKWAAGVMALTVFAAVVDPADASGARIPSLAASALMILISSLL
jgi:CDP-diacylglycerol--glycerol-3-phosphate 3-phosphatidyltransferase